MSPSLTDGAHHLNGAYNRTTSKDHEDCFVGTEHVGDMDLADYHKCKIVILIAGVPAKAEHSQLCTWEQWHPRPSNVKTIILAPQPAASTVTCGEFLYYVLSVTLQGNAHVLWD